MRHPALIALSHGHHEILILAMKCRKRALGQTRPVGAEGLADLVEEMKSFVASHLEGHFRAEETVLFPFLEAADAESRPLIAELRREHDHIREKSSLDVGSAHLSRALFDLADLLDRHIRREERELFPIFESRVPEAEGGEIKVRIEELLRA